MCGEKSPSGMSLSRFAGSPPRVRGKGVDRIVNARRGRITPACAGKRRHRPKADSLRQDHPRVCGEKLALVAIVFFVVGSPPRVRGKASVHSCPSNTLGITPACAGKRPQPNAAVMAQKDHPRVCGEKLFSLFRMWAFLGSPPRVRGKASMTVIL